MGHILVSEEELHRYYALVGDALESTFFYDDALCQAECSLISLQGDVRAYLTIIHPNGLEYSMHSYAPGIPTELGDLYGGYIRATDNHDLLFLLERKKILGRTTYPRYSSPYKSISRKEGKELWDSIAPLYAQVVQALDVKEVFT